MPHTIRSTSLSYIFSADATPVLEVGRGDQIIFETVDARGGRAMHPTDEYVLPPPAAMNRGNPVTGPAMVRDAEPGDTLVVSIEGIKLGSKGYWAVRQDMGILKDLVRKPSADIVEVREVTFLRVASAFRSGR